jgi:hypothetical protein
MAIELYQEPTKKMNLYLYIPPASAHPAGCIKGTVYGLTRRYYYYAQNTFRHRRLLNRGWNRDFMRKLILEACAAVERKAALPPAPVILNQAINGEGERLFIHIVYHPDDISRKRIQELYQQHCGDLLRAELGIVRPTIAYSRPKNIGDYITKAKLHQASGQTSSIIMGEFKNGLAPT